MNTDRKKQTAVVDTDFLNHLVEIRKPPDYVHTLICDFFDALRVRPVIHPLLFKYEVPSGQVSISKLFSEKIFEVVPFVEFLGNVNDPRRRYYAMQIAEIYKEFKGCSCPVSDVFCHWEKKASLGEVHCVVMCFFLNCPLFLSDDKDAQRLSAILKRKTQYPIVIYNRQDAGETLKAHGCSFGHTQLNLLTHFRS